MFFLNPKSEANNESAKNNKRFMNLSLVAVAIIVAFRGVGKVLNK